MQTPNRVDLAAHALARLVRRCRRRDQKLQRDVLADLCVSRRVDDRHAAAAQLTGDLIPTRKQRSFREIPAADHGRGGLSRSTWRGVASGAFDRWPSIVLSALSAFSWK